MEAPQSLVRRGRRRPWLHVSLNPAHRQHVRQWILTQVDIADAVVTLSIDGTVDTADLWWLYDDHRIMSDGSAWLLALMHEDQLEDEEFEKLDVPGFWTWYDLGRLGPSNERLP